MIEVRNTTNQEIILQGVLLREVGQPENSFEIPPLELRKWANDSAVIQSVSDGSVVVVLNGTDITEVSRAIGVLRGEGPVDDEGIPITTPFFRYESTLDGHFKGYQYTATNNTLSIFDELITTEIKVEAGWFEILDENAQVGDWIDFSVVDKDDVLGMFSALGLTVGNDVLEVGNLVRTEYINPRSTERCIFRVERPATVLPGLYFRVKYNSLGTVNDVDFKVTYQIYED